jgi:purine-nucleoside phosphorylase
MTQAALVEIAKRAPGYLPRIALVLGSGWGGLTAQLQDAVCIPYVELPGFPEATVAGHGGALWLGQIGPHTVAAMSGRQHGYERGVVDGMLRPLQVLKELGCRVLVQTNAAGSLRTDMPPGSLMLISDHLNMPQRSPLVGQGGTQRFVDMVDAYDPALRAQALAQCARGATGLRSGIYAWAFGPQFETPAEIRMLALLGADAVGMSTVPETILARYLGLRVVALSLITNMAAGLSTERLSHAHTLSQAAAASQQASAVLADIIANLQLD